VPGVEFATSYRAPIDVGTARGESHGTPSPALIGRKRPRLDEGGGESEAVDYFPMRKKKLKGEEARLLSDPDLDHLVHTVPDEAGEEGDGSPAQVSELDSVEWGIPGEAVT